MIEYDFKKKFFCTIKWTIKKKILSDKKLSQDYLSIFISARHLLCFQTQFARLVEKIFIKMADMIYDLDY